MLEMSIYIILITLALAIPIRWSLRKLKREVNFLRMAVGRVVAWREQREEVEGFELPRIPLRPRTVRQLPAQDDVQMREVIVQGRYKLLYFMVSRVLYYT